MKRRPTRTKAFQIVFQRGKKHGSGRLRTVRSGAGDGSGGSDSGGGSGGGGGEGGAGRVISRETVADAGGLVAVDHLGGAILSPLLSERALVSAASTTAAPLLPSGELQHLRNNCSNFIPAGARTKNKKKL